MANYPTPINLINALFQNVSEMQYEDLLELEPFPLESIPGNTEIDDCNNYLKIRQVNQQNPPDMGTIKVNAKMDTIPCNAFSSLFNIAASISTGSDYLTGLKLHFGINPQNEVCTIYQPVCLKKYKDSGNNIREYDIIIPSGKYFIYEPAHFMFQPATADDLKFMDEYKKRIDIIHQGKTVLEPFIHNVDVESATFTFQEIYALMLDNYPIKAITTYNCVRKSDPVSNPLIQHCIILSAEDDPSKFLDGNFKNKFGNRANLCPPECDRIKYKIVS